MVPAGDGGAAPAGHRPNSITELAAGEAAAAAEAHPYGVFWAAFLAGLVLGASPDVRDIVKTALRASDR